LRDQVLKEWFEDNKKILSNLDCFVDAVLLADAANLNEAKNVGVAWLHETFRSTHDRTGRIVFTEPHIRKLVPLLVKEDDLLCQTVASIFRGSGVNGSGIKSKEDLRSPLFPRALVMACRSCKTRVVQDAMQTAFAQVSCPATRTGVTAIEQGDGLVFKFISKSFFSRMTWTKGGGTLLVWKLMVKMATKLWNMKMVTKF
jgi:hypothetical protein